MSALSQGILVEVIGQDGLGVAPVSRKNYLTHYQYLSSSLANPELDGTGKVSSAILINLMVEFQAMFFLCPYGT